MDDDQASIDSTPFEPGQQAPTSPPPTQSDDGQMVSDSFILALEVTHETIRQMSPARDEDIDLTSLQGYGHHVKVERCFCKP